MDEFKKLMDIGKFSLFGYSYPKLPVFMQDYNQERAQIFFKRKGQKIRLDKENSWNYYSGYQDTPWCAKDIVFFDQDATKSLCIGFPAQSKFVMISLKYPQYYIFILAGILRRLFSRSIFIKGIVNLDNGSKFSPWLLIKCAELPTNSIRLSINKEIGVQGFLDFLSNEKIRYLVPKFYENLPNLHNQDADLDIIVENKDSKKVNNFLVKNSGEISILVYTDNGPDLNGISYFPTSKVKNAIYDAKKGPGGSMIPCKQDALNLIVYDALYNKGYISGIRSAKNLDFNKDSYYVKKIKSLCRDLQTDVGNTMEEMDLYMNEIGWKPAIDTLAKIGQWNEWVRDYHLAKKIIFVPLYVLILKEGVKNSFKEDTIKEKCSNEGLKLIEEVELYGATKQKAITELRGGIWNDSLSNPEDVVNFYPYKILVVWDTLSREIGGIAEVKEKLRMLVDEQKTSLIHSTDNYQESLDYIKVCIPDKFDFYKDENLVLNKFEQFLVNKKSIKHQIQSLLAIIKKESMAIVLKLISH